MRPADPFASARSRRRERGSASLEFALISPILLLFLFGTIEFGTYFFRFQVLHDAVSESARFAALARASCDAGAIEAAARATVVDRAAAIGVSLTSGEIAIVGTCDAVDYVSVSLSHPHSFAILSALATNFPSVLTLDVSSIALNHNS